MSECVEDHHLEKEGKQKQESAAHRCVANGKGRGMDDGTYLEESLKSVCYSEERKQQDVDCPLKTALRYIRRRSKP